MISRYVCAFSWKLIDLLKLRLLIECACVRLSVCFWHRFEATTKQINSLLKNDVEVRVLGVFALTLSPDVIDDHQGSTANMFF